jgi:hypothetical protein
MDKFLLKADGGLLRRDNVDKRKRKKRFIRLQVLTYRCNYSCEENLGGIHAGVGSSDT